jgi:programmed cell death 6-interacting protein
MDILDQEASEDELVQQEGKIRRQPSHEANTNLIETERRYRSILEEAAASDELVRDKWDEWETNIMELTWEEVSFSSFSGPALFLIVK